LGEDVSPAFENEEMAFARKEGGPGIGNSVSEILATLQGVVHVNLAVPDIDWKSDLFQAKAPRAYEHDGLPGGTIGCDPESLLYAF
jgi:hypothetical protein